MPRLITSFALAVCAVPWLLVAAPAALPTPESVIGFQPGADYKLFNYEQAIAYLKKLDAASDAMTLVEAGRDLGLIACGLAARDSLRTGAVLPLSHQDIGPWLYARHPWPFALPLDRSGKFTKEFLGSDAIEHPGDAPYTLTFVGNDLRKIDDTGFIDKLYA